MSALAHKASGSTFQTPGVYIGMPEDQYFAKDAIGGSSLKNILFQPEEWWWSSPHNALRVERTEKDGLRFGKALHKAVLEGLPAYEGDYCLAFNPDNHPDAIKTSEDLIEIIDRHNEDNFDPDAMVTAQGFRDKLRDHGAKISGPKAELEARLLTIDPDANICTFTPLSTTGPKATLIEAVLAIQDDVQIMDQLRAEHVEHNQGREFISPAWDAAIRMLHGIAHMDPSISKIVKGGLSEISVFWVEEGVPCRARFDKIRRACTFDLKSASMRPGQSMRQGMVRAVMNYRYDLQEAHYRAARAAMKGLPVHGGSDGERAYLQACIDEPNPDFKFLFCKSVGAPIFTETSLPPMVIEAAQDERIMALRKWKEYYDVFGLDRPWVVESQDTPIEIVDFPAYFGISA